MKLFNDTCITKTASTITTLLNIQSHKGADSPIDEVIKYATNKFSYGDCDRVFMYNPDAIAMWIYEKYINYFEKIDNIIDLKLKMLSVVPPVTPVCFGSMYSGLSPKQHGILKYEKPVLKVDTVFDDIVKAGKKAAIVSTQGDSISLIFLNRDIDYYIYKTKTECNNKALELIKDDNYDLIVLYNGDYDHWMHRFSPEGKRTLKALRENIDTYKEIYTAIRENWKTHNTVLSFAPDHGCHKAYFILGSHGIDEPCDMNIMHFYSFLPKQQ